MILPLLVSKRRSTVGEDEGEGEGEVEVEVWFDKSARRFPSSSLPVVGIGAACRSAELIRGLLVD